MAITYGKLREVFGMAEPNPLRGFPPGKVRLRLRNDCFARAFVRNGSIIRHFYIEEVDGFWQPCFEQGENISVQSSTWIPINGTRKPSSEDLSTDGKILVKYASGRTDLVGCLFAGSLFFDFDESEGEKVVSWMPIP